MGKARDIVRWILLMAFTVLGLLYLNYPSGSWWTLRGPPAEYPGALEHQAIQMLCAAIALLFTGPMAFVSLKPGYRFKKSVIIYAWFFTVLLSLLYPAAREFVLKDKCLDSGGAWNETRFECNR